MFKLLWYLTLSSSIWMTSVGSFSTSFGEVYPSQILVILVFFILILNKKIKINKTIGISLFMFGIMFLYGSISVIWSHNYLVSTKKLIQYFFGILFLVEFCIIVNNHEEFKKSIYVFTINYYMVTLIALFEIFTGNYFYANHYIQTVHLNNMGFHFPLVMLNNTNDLAVFIFLFFPIVLYSINAYSSHRKKKSLCLYIIVVFTIFNTESRLASALIVFYGFFFILCNMLKKFKSEKMKIFLMAFGGIFCVIILFILDSEIISTYIYTILNDPRIMIYSIALESFWKTFAFGLGIGGVYNISYMNIVNIHNYVLEILIEFGLIIFILYISWLCFIEYKLTKVYVDKYYSKTLLNYLRLDILFIPLWGSISSTITSRPHIWIFYALIILSTNLLNDSNDNKAALIVKKRGEKL